MTARGFKIYNILLKTDTYSTQILYHTFFLVPDEYM